MSEVEFIKWAILGLMSLGVWFMKRTLDNMEKQVEENKKAIQQVREEYLHKSEFKDFKSELRNMFEEIRTDIRSLNKH
jgi:hypothetical protein